MRKGQLTDFCPSVMPRQPPAEKWLVSGGNIYSRIKTGREYRAAGYSFALNSFRSCCPCLRCFMQPGTSVFFFFKGGGGVLMTTHAMVTRPLTSPPCEAGTEHARSGPDQARTQSPPRRTRGGGDYRGIIPSLVTLLTRRLARDGSAVWGNEPVSPPVPVQPPSQTDAR